MNPMKLVIPLHSLYWSIHTKDESKRGTAFAFIFGVNWLWRCGVTASFEVFFFLMTWNVMEWQVSWNSWLSWWISLGYWNLFLQQIRPKSVTVQSYFTNVDTEVFVQSILTQYHVLLQIEKINFSIKLLSEVWLDGSFRLLSPNVSN